MTSQDRATVTLKEFLEREMDRNDWSVSDLEIKTGVSRGAIRNILEKDGTIPKLETLVRFSRRLKEPLWRLVELAGLDTGIPDTPEGRATRITSLSQSMPELAEVLDHLGDLDREEMDGVLAYLEALRHRRGRRRDSDQ